MTDPTSDIMENDDDRMEQDDLPAAETETEAEESPPVRPEKTIRNTAVIYFCLALALLVCMGLFAATFGRTWLLLAFVPAIAVQLFIGYYYLGMYNKALNAFEAYEKAQKEAAKPAVEFFDDEPPGGESAKEE